MFWSTVVVNRFFFLSNLLTLKGDVTITLSYTRIVLTERCIFIFQIHGNLLSSFYSIFIQPYFILNEFACFLLSKSKREFSFNSHNSYQPSHFWKFFLNDVKQNEFLLWTPFLPQIKTFIFFTKVISENLHKDQTTNLHW